MHEQAFAALLAAGKREQSLADHTSFVLMRRLGMRTVLAIDRHFVQQGVATTPET